MQFKGAVILAKGLEVGIVVVDPHVLNDKTQYDEVSVGATKALGQGPFGWRPIVLMALDDEGEPTYMGSKDIIDLLSDLDFERYPWETYEI